jgi:hypothetical protein
MGAVAAAWRTQSAFPAYLATSKASGLHFQVYSSQSVASLGYLTKELEHLPQVARVAIAPTLFVTPVGTNGRALPNNVNSDEITTIGSEGGEYFTQDQVAVTAGRMANPNSTHEMMAKAAMATLAGWHLGETVKMGYLTVAQLNSGVNPATAKLQLFSAQLVGLVVFSSQVVSDDIDRYSTYQLLTPALTRKLQSGATYPNYGLRLRGGNAEVAAVEREIVRLVPKGNPYDFLVTSSTEGQVERSSKPEAIALGVFGAIGALAALLIAGQAISRALWADGEDLDVLRALGADSSTVTSDAIFGLLGAVVLGHKRIGQTVVVSYGSPEDAPIYQPPTHLTVVGTATMPAIGTGQTLHPSMGTGALFSDAILVPAFARALVNADPNLNGPAIEVVRTRSGVTPAAARSSLQRIADAANKVISDDRNPAAYGDSFIVLGVQRPAEIVNYQSTGASPGILAAGLAAGAVVALGLTLGASVRRRRRDIALLKTLGFTRRQLAVAVAWQASVAAVVGIVLGVPAGIALGRWLWDLFARAIYAIPLPTVPEVVLVALGSLVLANLVAAVPGQMAARTPTALVLRAE